MPSGHTSPRGMGLARRRAAKIVMTLAVIWTASSLIGVAAFFFPTVCVYGNEYGEPTPGWMYAVASFGAYVTGPLVITLSVRQKWGIGRYGAMLSLVGMIMALTAMCSKYIDQGNPVFLGMLSGITILSIPQVCSLGLISALRRNSQGGV